MHLKKNEGNAPPAETLCHQCGASSECEKAEAPGKCGASAAGSGLFLPHGEHARAILGAVPLSAVLSLGALGRLTPRRPRSP